MPALAIHRDLSAEELRRLARREPDRRAAMRLLAIANALEGLSRAEAARLAGMERQALRDAVPRYNAEGPGGLHDRPRSGRPEGLTPGQQASLKAWVLRGPNLERDGVSAWRAAGRHLRPCRGGLWRPLQRLGHVVPAQEARPLAPEGETLAPAGQRGRAGRVRKRSLARSSPKSPKPSRACGSGSGARMRPGSGGRAGSATAGTSVGCARPGWPTSGSRASACSPLVGPAPTKPSPLPCPRRPPRP